MAKKICGIYKIENLINGKVYIGQSSDIKKRWYSHKRDSSIETSKNYNYPLYKAFRKYGVDNFKFEIIEECLKEELNDKEIYYIQLYRSYINFEDSNGYNQTLGGDGSRGTHLNCIAKEKISKANKGKLKGGNNPSSKKVVCEDIIFDCAKECAEYYNIKYTTMRSWLNHSKNIPQKWYDKGLHYIDEPIENYVIAIKNLGKNNIKSKPVICENIEFSNVRECSEYYNINKNSMKNWLNKTNPMPKEWYDKGLRYKDKSMEDYTVQKSKSERKRTSKKVICEGKLFNSIKECAEYYNKSYSSMASWLNKSAYMPQEFYDKELHFENETMDCYKIQTGKLKGKNHPLARIVVCDNKEFSTIKECANYYNVNATTMSDWLKGKHKMPQQFKNLNLHFKE